MSQTEILLENLKSNDVKIRLSGEKLKIDAPKGELTVDTKELLKQHKAEIIQMLKSQITSFRKLDVATIKAINAKCAEWDRIGRKTANPFKWCNASLF